MNNQYGMSQLIKVYNAWWLLDQIRYLMSRGWDKIPTPKEKEEEDHE